MECRAPGRALSERRDLVRSEQRRRGVCATRVGQWKDPLDVVVHFLQMPIVPGQDFLEGAKHVIGAVAIVEPQNCTFSRHKDAGAVPAAHTSSSSTPARPAFAAVMILVCRCDGTSS